MESGLKEINENLMKLRRDLELIKNIILSEGELSEWAKKELEKARKRSESEYVPIEEVKKRILSKK